MGGEENKTVPEEEGACLERILTRGSPANIAFPFIRLSKIMIFWFWKDNIEYHLVIIMNDWFCHILQRWLVEALVFLVPCKEMACQFKRDGT